MESELDGSERLAVMWDMLGVETSGERQVENVTSL